MQAELSGIMFGDETAFQKGWNHLWLQCDSQLAIQAFKNNSIVPWKLRSRWRNMLLLAKKMHFVYSHVYREGNVCADKLANFGTTISSLVWWNSIPDFIKDDFFFDRISYTKYRFR